MQIGIKPAQTASGEDASKPLRSEHIRLSGTETPDSEAFGDLLQVPEDSEGPDPPIAEIFHSQADSFPRADTPALPNTGLHMHARRQSLAGYSIAASSHSGDEAPAYVQMGAGWRGPAIGGETSGSLAPTVEADNGNERHVASRSGDRHYGGRDVPNEAPPSEHPAGPGGDSVSDRALFPGIGTWDGKGDEGLVPRVSNAGQQAQHAIGHEVLKIKQEAREAVSNGMQSGAAGKGQDGVGGSVAAPVGGAALKEHEKLTEPALREPPSAGAVSDAVGGIMQAPQENAPLDMRRPGIRKPPNEARSATGEPVSASSKRFSNSANPARQKSDQGPIALAPASNPPRDMETKGSKAFQQGEKGEQKQAVSFPVSESGQALGDANSKAGNMDAPAFRAQTGHEAARSPLRPALVMVRGIPAKTGSYPDHGKGEGHCIGRISEPVVDVGISDETREKSLAQPVSGHRLFRSGNFTVIAAGVPSEVAGVETAQDLLEYSANAQADGIGVHSSTGPDAMREIAAVARGQAAPHTPVAERHVIQQIAQAAVQIANRPIELRLDPEELGRVRLVLSLGDHNAITVSINAERPETLDLMRRNISELSQEFRDLGYDNPEFTFGSGKNDQQDRREAIPHGLIPGVDIGAEAKADAAALRSGPEALVLEMSERLDLRL